MSNPFFNPLQMALMPLFKQAQAEDAEFANEVNEKSNRAENPKSWQQCCEYVLGEAYNYAKEHKDGNVAVAGCDDATLTSMIKHYYDEDNIKINKLPANTRVSANASVELTEEDKEKAREIALQEYKQQCINELLEKKKAKAKRASEKINQVSQPNLFGL